MTMPNFLIIGAMKAGTTSLYLYLRQHPQVFVAPLKEPWFFALEDETPNFCGPGDQEWLNITINNIESYRALFQGVTDEKAVGEASTAYLYNQKACDRIRYYVPDVRLIAILRDPVERAYSNFLHLVRDGREPLTDFVKALKEEENRRRMNWGWGWRYVDRGFYYVQLRRWYNTYDPCQIKVYLYEDLCNDPVALLRDIFRFLEVDQTFVPNTSSKANISSISKSKKLRAILGSSHPMKAFLRPFLTPVLRKRIVNYLKAVNMGRPKLPRTVRKSLIEIYRDDIKKLQGLIERDLSKWLEP